VYLWMIQKTQVFWSSLAPADDGRSREDPSCSMSWKPSHSTSFGVVLLAW